MLALKNEAGEREVGGRRRREVLLTMEDAPKIMRVDCDLCQAATVCMPPEMWSCGCVRVKLEESLYKQWMPEGGVGPIVLWLKSQKDVVPSIRFIRKEIASSQRTKREHAGRWQYSTQTKTSCPEKIKASSMPVADEGDVNAAIPSNLSGASLGQVTVTTTLIRLVQHNEMTMGRGSVDISDRGGQT